MKRSERDFVPWPPTEARLVIFAASIKDGRGNTLHRRLFAVETDGAGQMVVYEPPAS